MLVNSRRRQGAGCKSLRYLEEVLKHAARARQAPVRQLRQVDSFVLLRPPASQVRHPRPSDVSDTYSWADIAPCTKTVILDYRCIAKGRSRRQTVVQGAVRWLNKTVISKVGRLTGTTEGSPQRLTGRHRRSAATQRCSHLNLSKVAKSKPPARVGATSMAQHQRVAAAGTTAASGCTTLRLASSSRCSHPSPSTPA